MAKKVDIIVVNWNSGTLTLNAIKPYLNFKNDEIICNVIIVDNASTDDSLSLFENIDCTIIINATNRGFGHACNQAFKNSTADYILLLNPDTRSSINVLKSLVNFLENNQKYAVAGPRQITGKNITFRTCGRFPTFTTSIYEIFGLSKFMPSVFTPTPLMSEWDHLQNKTVDHVMGCYMLIRKLAVDEVGFMDDEYFVYYEDIDLSKRLSNAGYLSYFDSEHTIFHEGGSSGEFIKSKRLYYSITARRIYWKKHLNKLKYFLLFLLSLTVEPPLRMASSFASTRSFQFKNIFKAYFLYLKNIFQ